MHMQHGWGELRAFGGTHQSVAEALGGFQGVCVSGKIVLCTNQRARPVALALLLAASPP